MNVILYKLLYGKGLFDVRKHLISGFYFTGLILLWNCYKNWNLKVCDTKSNIYEKFNEYIRGFRIIWKHKVGDHIYSVFSQKQSKDFFNLYVTILNHEVHITCFIFVIGATFFLLIQYYCEILCMLQCVLILVYIFRSIN